MPLGRMNMKKKPTIVTIDGEDYIPTTDAANLLGLSPATLRSHAARHQRTAEGIERRTISSITLWHLADVVTQRNQRKTAPPDPQLF